MNIKTLLDVLITVPLLSMMNEEKLIRKVLNSVKITVINLLAKDDCYLSVTYNNFKEINEGNSEVNFGAKV